ncbi:MAG: RMD1 family protein [Hahellaceae bacterium]|nr:RMD1 family protein [Hahellaceae bacterium]MCP5170562.1 RMD1 family protein [Hahellaceae bacterium]
MQPTEKKSFSSNKVTAVALGNDFRQAALEEYVFSSLRGSRYRDAIHADLDGGEAWIFNYGVVVFWGVKEDERQMLLSRLAPFVADPLNRFEEENYKFELEAEQDRFHSDAIKLTTHNPLQRLAVSHALAQSVKLNLFESRAQQTIIETSHVPHSLAKTGRIALSRKETAKMRGSLFSTKSDIILNYGLLDTPDFFWEYPELEPMYAMSARYLEITPRVEVMSKKLETIHELFEMLADEQKHKHSATLEWIIIILIAAEILLYIGNIH